METGIYTVLKNNTQDLEEKIHRTSPVVHAANAVGGLSSIPSQGTRSHMPQLRVRMPQPKILPAATQDPPCRN